MLRKEKKQNQDLFAPYFVSRRPELKGDSLKFAAVDYQQFGQPIVSMKFDAKGARKFATVTSDYAPGGAKNPSLEGMTLPGGSCSTGTCTRRPTSRAPSTAARPSSRAPSR